MRPAVTWLLAAALALAALAAARADDEPWVEEEDLEEPYNEDEDYEPHERARRRAYVERPTEEHVRVKRKGAAGEPARRRRQLHQYEVHELSDEFAAPAPPYEEMLAASAEHYHKVYAAPGAPATARYLNSHVSAVPIPLGVFRPVASYNPVQLAASSNQAHIDVTHANVAPVNLAPAPLSVAQAHAPIVGPVPVASVPVSNTIKKLSDGDLYGSASGHHGHHNHHGHHSHGHSHGGGHGGGHHKHGDHYSDHGGKTTKGSKSHHYLDKGNKGHKIDEHHRKEYEEAEGKKKKHHDKAGHKGDHEEEAYGSRGSHFDEKKGHKKGHKTKGYHNKYHKDEFHKEHKFYDDFHKSGEHHRFGKFHAKHASNESGKKKAHHVDAGHDFVEKGKKGYSNKGHMDADHRGYHGKDGHEEHHGHHHEHGKKGGKDGGSHWGYAKKH